MALEAIGSWCLRHDAEWVRDYLAQRSIEAAVIDRGEQYHYRWSVRVNPADANTARNLRQWGFPENARQG